MRSIDQLDVHGKRVLVRVDFNVPMTTDDHGAWAVADDTRIVQALPTIEELRARGARLVLVSHLGRPKGRPEADLSLAPVAQRLRELTGGKRDARARGRGSSAHTSSLRSLRDGEILLLENVRFEPGETTNDPELARALAELADVYVNDAFGAAHRAHASTAGVAHLLPMRGGTPARTRGEHSDRHPRASRATAGSDHRRSEGSRQDRRDRPVPASWPTW